MSKCILWVLCGIQCSGKSTMTETIKIMSQIQDKPCKILSSDNYRKENPDWDNNQVFSQLYKDMNEALQIGDCVVDATNITIKSRQQIFNNLKVDCIKYCCVMNTPYNICKERLIKRNEDLSSHKVPLNVLERYYKSFEIPFKEEGWDKIVFNNPLTITMEDDVINSFKDRIKNLMDNFDQKCKWHLEALGEHCQAVSDYLQDACLFEEGFEPDSALVEAGMYHDFGKLKTQKPKEKEPGEMCYYNHANVGAYDLMCIPNLFEKPLESLFYINYHMLAFDIKKSVKTTNKYLKIFGEYKLKNLMLFNKADIKGVKTNLIHEEVK